MRGKFRFLSLVLYFLLIIAITASLSGHSDAQIEIERPFDLGPTIKMGPSIELHPIEIEPRPVEIEPRPIEIEPQPVEIERQPAVAQPAEAQPAEAQPAEVQPAEAQPAEAQPAEIDTPPPVADATLPAVDSTLSATKGAISAMGDAGSTTNATQSATPANNTSESQSATTTSNGGHLRETDLPPSYPYQMPPRWLGGHLYERDLPPSYSYQNTPHPGGEDLGKIDPPSSYIFHSYPGSNTSESPGEGSGRGGNGGNGSAGGFGGNGGDGNSQGRDDGSYSANPISPPPPPPPTLSRTFVFAVCLTANDFDPHCRDMNSEETARELADEIIKDVREESVLSVAFPSYLSASQARRDLARITISAVQLVYAKLNADLLRIKPFERDSPELLREKAETVRLSERELKEWRRSASAGASRDWRRVTRSTYRFSGAAQRRIRASLGHAYNQAVSIDQDDGSFD